MNNEITCFVPLVIFIPEEQSYLNLAAELAINRHNLLQDNMSDNYVTVNFHKINHRDPRSWSNSIKNVCLNIQNDTIEHPDLLIDLTPPSQASCGIQKLAQQIDSGIITLNYYDCPPLYINQTLLNKSNLITELNIPSVNFPPEAVASALSVFGNTIAGSLRTETIIRGSDESGSQISISDYRDYPSVRRFYLTLPSQLNESQLAQSLEEIKNVVMNKLWLLLVDSQTVWNILTTVAKFQQTDVQNWIIYEEHVNCNFLCMGSDVTGKRNCLTYSNLNKLYCLKIGTSGADKNELEMIQNYYGIIWNNESFKQFVALSAYETVKSGLLALNSLLVDNQWPESIKSTNSSRKICDSSVPTIDSTMRFYRYLEAITRLPKRNGTTGIIDFNKTVTNQHAIFHLQQCFGKSNSSEAMCYDVNSTFIYPQNKVTYNQNMLESDRRQKIHVSVIHDPPYAVRLGRNKWTGYCVEVFEEIARRLNIDYEFVEQTDGDYGTRLENGRWSGMIGQVSRKNTDIGLGPLIQDAEKSLIVDFTVPYYESVGITMVSKINEDLKLGALFFLDVFTWDVWVTAVVVVFIIGFLLAFIDKYSPYSYQNQPKKGDSESMGTVFTVKESLWYVLGSCTQQGEYMDPRSASTRILVAGLWLLVLIIIAMFSANLAAKLTVSGLQGEINTFKKLIEQKEVKYTVRSNSSELKFFEKLKSAEESIFEIWKQKVVYNNEFTANYTVWQYPVTEKYGIIYSRMREWGFSNSHEETIKLINDGWVIFMETPRAAYYIANECKLKRFDNRIGSWYYSMILIPRSPLTSAFNEIIYSLEADYTLDTLRAKWWASNTSRCGTLSVDEGYDFEEVGGMFSLLGCGLLIGVVLLISEIVTFHILLKKQQTQVANEPQRLPPQPVTNSVPETIQEEEESTYNLSTRNPVASNLITITTTDYSDPNQEAISLNE
ncbi:glutamate receptor, ionotropic, invertebrate [Schistosoma bovis]|uniref:Glutamate receptor, ionotropic, invertebrate n=1 Tax=Schistosoma bovis TaxID=6184 RepID=A0A430QLG9_SCHBO|nr:glutamate receptor, ionotropic, invertebrate [Schistosoma bovis]